MKKIIAITGMPVSGKSTVVELLKKDGFKFASMGDAVRKEMSDKGLEINNISLRNYALRMGEISEYYALELVKKELDNLLRDNDVVVLDGVRRLAEINKLKQYGYAIISVGVIADKNMRYERMVKRARSSDIKTFEEFEWREAQELKFGVAGVMATADYHIINNSGIDELTSNLKELLRKI